MAQYSINYNDQKLVDGRTLYRIVNQNGLKGGFLEGPNNLSQGGKCWLHDDSVAYGNAVISDDAQVTGQVYGSAQIRDRAVLYGQAFDNAVAKDDCKIYGIIFGTAIVGGHEVVYGIRNS